MRRYLLPVLSAALIAFSLYPFSIWPLALVALAPFFYFAAQPRHSRKQIFWGGCIAGALAVTPTLYWSLLHLAMQPGAPALTYAVRFSSVFFFVFIGILFGAVALLYRYLRTGRPLADSVLAAALYSVLEFILFFIFNGYYYASLAHALTPFPPALLIASLGGVPLLILLVAWTSAVLAQRSWRLALGAFAFLSLLCGGAFWYGQTHTIEKGSLTVAAIQRPAESLLYVTAPAPEPFGDYGLQKLITSASGGGTTLVVYPFSPVEATYQGSKPVIETLVNVEPDETLGAWLGTIAPASTTVVLWNTLARQGSLYDSFEFWSGGAEQIYQKHILHPFSDYTPPLLRQFGLARLPYEITPGGANDTSVQGVRFGGLACSELQQEGYARAQAARADVLLSVGFDGFFPGVVAAEWSLQTARLRAAETGTPLLRANIFSSSALIRADGSIQTELPPGAGVLRGTLQVEKISTLYAALGSTPAYCFIAAVLAAALYRRRAKFLGSAGR